MSGCIRRHTRVGLAGMIAAATFALMPHAYAMSCAIEGTLRQRLQHAPTVFVGTVLDTHSGDAVAEVNVESVWRGKVPNPVVSVRGSQGGDFFFFGSGSSGDVELDRGVRYLFVPQRRDGAFAVDACIDTQAWDRSLERLRPAAAAPVNGPPDMTPPPGTASPTAPLPLWVGGAALVSLAGLGVVLMVRRRSGSTTA